RNVNWGFSLSAFWCSCLRQIASSTRSNSNYPIDQCQLLFLQHLSSEVTQIHPISTKETFKA
ncbi:hypothetical protein SNB83_10715, partial [Escherichia coli]|nr:hypothetical protein [Escherichia coli]MDZ9722801.1 hypothetical protein [Escherichia coli]